MRLEAQTGTSTTWRSRAVWERHAPRGTCDDRRHPRLVPADAGVEDRDARGLQVQRQLGGLVPGLAALDQVEQGDAEDDREDVADELARASYDIDGEVHPAHGRAAPLVVAVVGALGEELVDEVALGAHDLDGVVAGLAGQGDRLREGRRRRVDLLGRHRARPERRDGGLLRRRALGERVVAVAARVQHLQRDRAALVVDRARDPLVADRVQPARHLRGEGLEPTALGGGVAAGDDQAGAAAGALGEEGAQLADVPRVVLETGVHRPHHHAVAQRQRVRAGAEGERLEEVGVAGVAHAVSPWACR